MKSILGKSKKSAGAAKVSAAIGLCVSRDLDMVPQHLIGRLESGAGWNIAFVSVCAILKSCCLERDLQAGRTLLRS